MNVSESLKALSSIFIAHGFSLYLVGGAVRDYLLSKPSHDYDFTTDARPEEIKSMFRHTIDTGIKHGTITAIFEPAIRFLLQILCISPLFPLPSRP